MYRVPGSMWGLFNAGQGGKITFSEPLWEKRPRVFRGSLLETMCRTKKAINFNQNFDHYSFVDIVVSRGAKLSWHRMFLREPISAFSAIYFLRSFGKPCFFIK